MCSRKLKQPGETSSVCSRAVCRTPETPFRWAWVRRPRTPHLKLRRGYRALGCLRLICVSPGGGWAGRQACRQAGIPLACCPGPRQTERQSLNQSLSQSVRQTGLQACAQPVVQGQGRHIVRHLFMQTGRQAGRD